jgi:hypothetical protein
MQQLSIVAMTSSAASLLKGCEPAAPPRKREQSALFVESASDVLNRSCNRWQAISEKKVTGASFKEFFYRLKESRRVQTLSLSSRFAMFSMAKLQSWTHVVQTDS